MLANNTLIQSTLFDVVLFALSTTRTAVAARPLHQEQSLAAGFFRAEPAGYYPLVFMDLMVPVMDGYAATAAIRAASRPDAATIPIIALTANAFAEDVENARKGGMNGHLAKPFKVEELYGVVRRAIVPA